ncbi:putative RNA-directed DNA polymerase [Helianthus annuus]|nr:putative RNA-directed DNA polymerase [Helianthus annuus]KAJ0469226.1 putative RNA-directed DNA polymerase [Helianthus annuus]KAJ0486207.1 putative RNA-directed DNA polymerase [Helianthus annuus]KAJ0656756.1 putative RNA-directed DNA polymerase [Helianthus annuus]
MAGGQPENQKTEAIDSSSPYYIHASDSPRQMQTNDPLTDSNYSDWVQEIENFLFAKNKMGFVNGTIPKPDEKHNTYTAWMRCDAMIKGWLTASMEKTIRGSVKYANTSAEIWADLKERFGKESAPRAYELKQKITVTRQDNNSVSAYYTALRSLWDEISSVLPTPRCTCGHCTCEIGKRLNEFQEKERLYQFLMGLDGGFSTIRTQVLSMKPNPTLREAYRLASEDEQQRSITASKEGHIEPAAFQTYSQGRRDGTNRRGNSGDKVLQRDYKRNNDGQEHCTICGRDGHKKEGCFKVIGYPDWWPGKLKNEKAKPKVAHVDGEGSTVGGLTDTQYQTLLKHLSENNDKAQGDVSRKANMAGMGLHSKKLIGAGKCVHGLYRMGVLRDDRRVMTLKTDAEVWHSRLGHASTSKLSHIESLKNVSFGFKYHVCHACMKAKHTRSIFPKSFIKSNECFELIHCDIWGKYRKPSTGLANFFLTIVDDYSRGVWVYLIKT